jgi:hypothetical protein
MIFINTGRVMSPDVMHHPGLFWGGRFLAIILYLLYIYAGGPRRVPPAPSDTPRALAIISLLRCGWTNGRGWAFHSRGWCVHSTIST